MKETLIIAFAFFQGRWDFPRDKKNRYESLNISFFHLGNWIEHNIIIIIKIQTCRRGGCVPSSAGSFRGSLFRDKMGEVPSSQGSYHMTESGSAGTDFNPRA